MDEYEPCRRVNQASLTGESIPVPKRPGGAVYAGTVVEEGECVLEVKQASGQSRYDQIVHMIEQSEQMKSEAESRAANLADKLVPYTLSLIHICSGLHQAALRAGELRCGRDLQRPPCHATPGKGSGGSLAGSEAGGDVYKRQVRHQLPHIFTAALELKLPVLDVPAHAGELRPAAATFFFHQGEAGIHRAADGGGAGDPVEHILRLFFPQMVDAVSYTHLDVYKRQMTLIGRRCKHSNVLS